jgi:hypothetical protein
VDAIRPFDHICSRSGKTLHQDRARPFKRRGRIDHLLFVIDKIRGHKLRIVLWLRQQQFGQRLEAGLPGNLGLGAAFRLERKIDVFQPPFAVGGQDCRFQRGIELALFTNRIENSCAPLLKFAQIVQALFQGAQLRVVEPTGDFLAVSRNERDRGAAVEQRHRCLDLLFADAKFFRYLSIDVCHANLSEAATAGQFVGRGDAAYGPSGIDSSTHAIKQIVLWMDIFAHRGRGACDIPLSD